MFSLNPGSLCDVCAEEYGSHNYPHSIPCGESPFPTTVPVERFSLVVVATVVQATYYA